MIVNFSDIFEKLDDILTALAKLYDYGEFIDDDYSENFLNDLGLVEDALDLTEKTAKQVQEDLTDILQ